MMSVCKKWWNIFFKKTNAHHSSAAPLHTPYKRRTELSRPEADSPPDLCRTGRTAADEFWILCLDALKKTHSRHGGHQVPVDMVDERDYLELMSLTPVMMSCKEEYQIKYGPQVERVINETNAGKFDGIALGILSFFKKGSCFDSVLDGDAAALGRSFVETLDHWLDVAETDPDPETRGLALATGGCWSGMFVDCLLLGDDFTWDLVPEATMIKTIREYKWSWHDYLCENSQADYLISSPGPAYVAMWKYGNVEEAYFHMTQSMDLMRRALENDNRSAEEWGLVAVGCSWPFFAHLAGRPEPVVAFLNDCELTWEGATGWVDTLTFAAIRPRSVDAKGEHLVDCLFVEYACKAGYILVSSRTDLSADEVMAGLPTREEYIEIIHTKDPEKNGMAVVFFWSVNVVIAFVCLKFKKYEEAIMWAGMTFDTQKNGGAIIPMVQIFSHLALGRAHAAMGAVQKATVAFEAGAELAATHEVSMLEVWLLRDLKLYVLDKAGKADEGSRRVGTVRCNGSLSLPPCMFAELPRASRAALSCAEIAVATAGDPQDAECRAEFSRPGALRLARRGDGAGGDRNTSLAGVGYYRVIADVDSMILVMIFCQEQPALPLVALSLSWCICCTCKTL